MFEKTLTDVVKGIRASKRDTALYISQCIAEIKTEISSSDMYVKSNALQKLTFLQMMGYSMNWASFATIEVMSSPRFAHKRIGYLAASQGFTQDTEVILLTTNLLKKELRGAIGGAMHGVYQAGLAINCISNIVTADLAQDLLPEIVNLTQHPQPYLRKKAILCLFKLFVKYPQGLRLTFARFQQCLNDANPSVVSCAVNVITELSDKNPKNYLHLAPSFFELLTQSSNNWMLIKVVKLLGSLVPEEPRLARKLLEPLSAIVKSTQAKSLQYEAAHAITLCLPYCRKSDGTMPAIVPDIVTLCAQTLRGFVEEADQNLKYLGLVGFGSLIQSHPRVLGAPDYRPLILACLSDQDVTIRRRALDLLPAMATRKNLMELVSQLLSHVEQATGRYKLDLVAKIIEMCSNEKYALLTDFVWYLNLLLVRLGHMRDVEAHAQLIASQITDVALRVLPVRCYAVRKSMEILLEGDNNNNTTARSGMINNGNDDDDDEDDDGRCCDNGRGKHVMREILPAIAWIVGEYSDLIREALTMREEDDDEDDDSGDEEDFFYDDASRGSYHAIIQALTAPSNTQKLPTTTQKVYVQATMKVFAAATADSKCTKSELEACVQTIHVNVAIYMQSTDVEVLERAFSALELLKSLHLVDNNINTTTTTNGFPILAATAEEDDSSEEDDQGDLLGIGQGEGTTTTTTTPKRIRTLASSPSLSLSKTLKEASPVLNYLLKPSPMKPVGAKAQRKKRSSLNGTGVKADLDAPMHASIFNDLIAEEEKYRAESKLSIETICFTQQRPLKIEEPVLTAISSGAPMEGISSHQQPPFTGIGSSANISDPSTSFQNQISGSHVTTGSSTPRQRQGDPFYLDSTPAATTNGSAQQQQLHQDDSRFGTIQLLDSDDDEPKKRKKREKKAKRSKANNKQRASVGNSDNLLSFGDSINSAKAPVTMYSSDDEDDGDDGLPGTYAGKRKGPSKEFAGLAKVDLTTPLREDEVMPERKHHVVADRPREADKPPKVKKKPKKPSKKKSFKPEGGGDAVGDLLGLGSFEMSSAPAPSELAATSAPSPAAAAPLVTETITNPINAAFDDLLGLSAPVPAPLLGGDFSEMLSPQSPSSTVFGDASPSSKKGGKRPWMKAALKLSSAHGSSSFDWTKMSLSYRVYSTVHEGNTAALIVVRFDNQSQSLATNLMLELKNQGEIAIGNIAPGSTTDTSKIGPFVYSTVDSSLDCKGTLRSSGFEVPFKLSFPASIHLSPEENLSLDQVAQEMASGNWSSDSVKVDLTSGLPPESVKKLLGSFLRASEVNGGPSSSALTGTFSAYSVSSGARVRALVKIKEKSVKIDIRCTSATLGKALASDCKRLLL